MVKKNDNTDEKDIVSLLRENLKVLNPPLVGTEGLPHYLDNMLENEKKDFLASASNVFNNRTFKKIADFLMKYQANITLNQAETWQQALNGRMIINGILTFYLEFERLDKEYQEEIKNPPPKEEEDKTKLF